MREISNKEKQRLAALEDYDILDSESEAEVDDLARLAAHICQAPVALVTFINEERQWFKSHVGTALEEMDRETSFCTHALGQDAPLVVENTLADKRFAGNPLVTGATHIRFYAGTVLRTAKGHDIGTICVLDKKPGALSTEQRDALQALGRQAVLQLERRKLLKELKASHDELLVLDRLKDDIIGKTIYDKIMQYY